jgi:LysM repeat protein
MNDVFSDLLDRIRENLVSIMAVLMMVMILFGYLFYVLNTIMPQWQLRNDLITRVTAAEAEIAQSSQGQQSNVEELKNQISEAPNALANAADFLITEAQANQFLSDLYQYASLSDVEIVELQTQTNPSSDQDTLFIVKQFQLQVDGKLEKLIEFLARMEEVSQPSYILNNVRLTEGTPQDSLTMTIFLYTSPYAPEYFVETNPNTPIPLTSSPLPESAPLRYVVLPGDTLLSISRQFNISLSAIRQINDLAGNVISPNQELLIPR